MKIVVIALLAFTPLLRGAAASAGDQKAAEKKAKVAHNKFLIQFHKYGSEKMAHLKAEIEGLRTRVGQIADGEGTWYDPNKPSEVGAFLYIRDSLQHHVNGRFEVLQKLFPKESALDLYRALFSGSQTLAEVSIENVQLEQGALDEPCFVARLYKKQVEVVLARVPVRLPDDEEAALDAVMAALG